MPAELTGDIDPTTAWPDNRFAPTANGTSCFVIEVPPDAPDTPPFMHSTETLDYLVVLRGEIYCVLEDGEVLLKTGDICVQRGARHAWSNRTSAPCLLFAVMIDGVSG
ncbi:MAG: cupin domain-containing protein [Phenylobacterium sp.]|uniref:cupin domain-containing protein n=1 Tax=Phenylobacterium sp. TaxID=1871053 RepID=UPI0025F1A284|nr:cupin domain-containing protein [Phenylobacterium sp.]MCA6232008.1 cupin domain-containing protein [Phenylobacterium sp.]MCA6235070.1 cupin domain-containing protein [Phenylobacterium sp.]MCA6248514.1 cupin domain-containing protein [Phenylobacterium sp.]MCA6251157.1 cupin domain-containing protein [Phenylobacterium sp.]MCA6256719.1 cupin domain-containing protein [Phenylobacterium sp.]